MDDVSTDEADDSEEEYYDRCDEDGVLIEQIYEEDDQYDDAEEEVTERRSGQFCVHSLFAKPSDNTERRVTKSNVNY